MAFATLSVLLVALGVAHASEDCTDIDYFLSISAEEISCAMLSSAGQCGCYVYAGGAGSNWVDASSVRVPHSAAETGGRHTPRQTHDPRHGRAHARSHAHQRR